MDFVPIVAILGKEKRVVAAFRTAGALSPTHARAPSEELGVSAGLALRRLRRNAVVRETPEGALYLDQASWEAFRAQRRRVAMTISSIALAGLAVFFYLQRWPKSKHGRCDAPASHRPE